ncbi:IclR family transcriptional regulator [Haloarcula nitratireducens]|uniref:IclR family transcriptional regulator n=1 Tax=Haloarcula nitratireducens TaxID=2487749 RepID=A0AAW4PJ35_9EURY|nr:IclR family transcriptional regulator [Halomicroarcula nitratireducens]MBX0298014.1 IclR family transcriptional regulator [Halomicroarcula nitratireducens]
MDGTSGRTLQTVETSLAVIDVIQKRDGARISEVADELDLALSTVHGHLNTLVQNEYLIKEGDEYDISLTFSEKAEYAKTRKKVFQLAEETVTKLADETGHRAYFVVEEHGWAKYVHTATGNPSVKVSGRIDHLHASAAGKAILAHMPDERVEEIIDEKGLPAMTAKTITDREELESEFERIREQGVSFNKGETIEGLYAAGVPVKGIDNRVVGSLSVSGAKKKMEGPWFTEELPELLAGVANELELNISHT